MKEPAIPALMELHSHGIITTTYDSFEDCVEKLIRDIEAAEPEKYENLYITGPSYSVQFSSVTQLYPTLCDLMNHSTPGLPVHHQLPEFTQTHIH